MGEFTLTDDVQDGEGKLNPNVFLRLAQLQGPLAPLFPNLRRLRIVKADYSLDYLHLFLSPSLETLEIVGLGEDCQASLLSFLSAAVVEVPNLSNLIIGSGRLSCDVVNTCLGFYRLKHLELVNAVSEVDHRLLKDIGRLEHLETFVIDAQGVGYTPSQAILQAEEDERARVIAEEEHRRQRIEEEECARAVAQEEILRQQMEEFKRERQRRSEAVEERQRKAVLPRISGTCWMCGRKTGPKGWPTGTVCKSCFRKENERRTEEEEQKSYQEREDAWRSWEEAQEEKKRCEEAVAEFRRRIERDDLYLSEAESKYQESVEETERKDNTDGLDTSATSSFPEADDGSVTQASIDRQEPLSHPKFPKLLSITVCGSAEMMQDLVELVTSASVAHFCLDMVLAQPSPSSSIIATPPSMRFVATVDSSLRRWASTMAHVTLSSFLPSVVSKLPDETVGALVRLPHLEHLEVNGWDIASNIADYFCSPAAAKTTKLKALHLPIDGNTTFIPLSKLQIIAGACPNLLSLRCRFDHLLDIPSYSVPAQISSPHLLETLSVGDILPSLGFGAILEVARYIDNLFPKIKDIKPLEGVAQNTEQWRQIDQLVKFRQAGRWETSLGAFSV